MTPFQPKPRACAHCGSLFTPMRAFAQVCSPVCAIKLGKTKKAQEKVALKVRKAALKRIPDLIKEAQTAFNAFIRERDRGQNCICCPGVPLGSDAPGGAYDCGHWRSTGSASHLRFNEDNAAGQNKRCNRWGAGRAVDMRRGLVERLGTERVEGLEASNAPHKWERDELIAIKALYVGKLKALLKEKA